MKTKEELKAHWRHARAGQIMEKTKFRIRVSRQRIQASKSLIALGKRLRDKT